jgi:GT2 family glycosyltransferase
VGDESAGAAVTGLPANRVVVVVLNWCNEADTVACLQSVLAQRLLGVVPLLVDNGSPDGSGDRVAAAFPEVPYLQTGRNLGYTGGNNRGFAWALREGADHVLVLNNDAVLEPGCVARLLDAANSDAEVGLVAPKILALDDPGRVWFAGGSISLARGVGRHWREGERDDRDRDPPSPVPIGFATGCCFLITRRALEAAGGFEESFFAYGEDLDLSFRLARLGFRLVFEPAARVRHRDPAARGAPSVFQLVQRDRNRRRFARLRLGRARRLAFGCWFYPTRAAHLLRYLAQGDRARAGAIWRGMWAPV